MIFKALGRDVNIVRLREYCNIGREGVSLQGIGDAADRLGMHTMAVKVDTDKLSKEAPLPAILHWNQNHFVVLFKVTRKLFARHFVYHIADPANGIVKLNRAEFDASWAVPQDIGAPKGIAMLLETTPAFNNHDEQEQSSKIGAHYLWQYIRQNSKYLWQLVFGILLGTILQILLPILTQNVVDVGINTSSFGFVQLVLVAQTVLLLCRLFVEFIRGRLVLFVSTRINLKLLSGFWQKILRLPISYHATKNTGDMMQRLNDQHRIESFLTGGTLTVAFGILNLVVFSIMLLNYNPGIFFVFAVSAVLYLAWIVLFLRIRRTIDQQRFLLAGKENTATMQILNGIADIKLNNAETLFRWHWEGLQAKLFKLQFRSLSYSQWQQLGAFCINEGKNLAITFIVAKLVIDGKLTLGAMVAIQYIIAQLNGPLEQLIGFAQSAQDAKLSLERLNEIHQENDEQQAEQVPFPTDKLAAGITIKDLSFSYPGASSAIVIGNLSMHIPAGKVTALVGMSGSGKTTILKLLLRYYDRYTGEINIGATNMTSVDPSSWRSYCGSVLQDGFIFNDSIAKNIAVGEQCADLERLQQAVRVANLDTFINELPLGFSTKIGAEGIGLSQGQRQRLLIARAVYKDPQYLFFDEATNALDANNEKVIMENLQQFFAHRTVVVVAHRLSTVRNADQIIVLKNGRIAEFGTHTELVQNKQQYWELVHNQLELGN
jgi:ATP-binding cassette, subfamily B, bacterial